MVYEEFTLTAIQSTSAIAKRMSIDTIISVEKSIQHFHAIYDLIQYSSTFDLRCKNPHGLPRGFCSGLVYDLFSRGFPCDELLHGNPHGKPRGGLVV